MANKVQIKRSNVAKKVPVPTDLEIGELAINLADKKVYTKEPGGTVIELADDAVTVAAAAPAAPKKGDLWYDDTKDGRMYVWDGTQWVDSSPASNLGIKTFDATQTYALDDQVIQSGKLYVAKGAVPAGPFQPTQWDVVTGVTDLTALVQKAGDTMTGALNAPEVNVTITDPAKSGLTITSAAGQTSNPLTIKHNIGTYNFSAGGTVTIDRFRAGDNTGGILNFLPGDVPNRGICATSLSNVNGALSLNSDEADTHGNIPMLFRSGAKFWTWLVGPDIVGNAFCIYKAIDNGKTLHNPPGLFLDIASNAWRSGSDARLKENVTDIDFGLNAVVGMRPVKFDWKNGIKGQYGFIAQELEIVYSPAIQSGTSKPSDFGLNDADDSPIKTISNDSLIPVLVKAIQELTARLEALEGKQITPGSDGRPTLTDPSPAEVVPVQTPEEKLAALGLTKEDLKALLT